MNLYAKSLSPCDPFVAKEVAYKFVCKTQLKKFHLEIFVRGFGVIPKIYKTLKGIINIITEKITYQIKIKVSYNDWPTDGIHQY